MEGDLESPDNQELVLPPNSRTLWHVAQALMDVSDEMEKEQTNVALPKLGDTSRSSVKKRLIHYYENGNDKEWYYLVRDMETDDVFVIHEWSRRQGGGKFENGSEEFDLDGFLRHGGETQNRLRFLIGTLV